MPHHLTRRSALASAGAGAAVLSSGLGLVNAAAGRDITPEMQAIERRIGGRVGVSAFHAGSRLQVGYRADERFPICSVFKLLAAACTLARADRGDEDLERRILFSERDLVSYSPVTRGRIHGNGMSLAELCEAAVTVSDNTAGNLLLASFGGPPGLTAYVRTLGDEVTRLDRIEPDLNSALPGDPQDTTAPAAILEDARVILIGGGLKPTSRDTLMSWLTASRTGDKRLRAGFPKGWRVGGKTGSGELGTANDLVIASPPDAIPILVAAFITGAKASDVKLNEALAEIGAKVVGALR